MNTRQTKTVAHKSAGPSQPFQAHQTNPILKLQSQIGNQAVLRMLQREHSGLLQRELHVKKTATFEEKLDSELIDDYLGFQMTILEGWDTALDNFKDVMKSESDKAGQPNFKDAIVSYFQDKVMSFALSKVPGATGEIASFMDELATEVKRAEKARESATLRDFFVLNRTIIGKLRQKIHSMGGDLKASLRIARERANAAYATDAEAEAAMNEFGMLRVYLEETTKSLQTQSLASTPEAIFKVLTEQWMRTTSPGKGQLASLTIKIDESFKITKATINSQGGEKLAEELLRESPDGVDVYGMAVPRTIELHKSGSDWPSGVVKLNAYGQLINRGQINEGDYQSLYEQLQKRGLPPTKELE